MTALEKDALWLYCWVPLNGDLTAFWVLGWQVATSHGHGTEICKFFCWFPVFCAGFWQNTNHSKKWLCTYNHVIHLTTSIKRVRTLGPVMWVPQCMTITANAEISVPIAVINEDHQWISWFRKWWWEQTVECTNQQNKSLSINLQQINCRSLNILRPEIFCG